MTTRISTSYFVSFKRALKYFDQYVPGQKKEDLHKWVENMIFNGSISIGKPPESMGRVVGTNSEGRYEVEL